jgi:MFS family permease
LSTSATTAPLSHPFTPGSARAALSYRNFRLIWMGMGASMVGTWMQNVALGAYIQDRTRSGALVAVMTFAQLGPLLFLSIPGGAVADRFPRRPYLITMQSVQLVGSLGLALLTAAESTLTALFFCNLAIGMANALGNPALQASVPMLVDRRDLPGVISLNSTQLNGSRVVGPLIVGLISLWGVTTAQIYALNAVTYLFMIMALMIVDVPHPGHGKGPAGLRRLTVGFNVARRRHPVGRVLATMALFSFFSLPFIGLFPTIADVGLHIEPSSSTYKWLYATWALGACLGALSSGTVLARVDKARLVRPALVGFTVSLAAFGLVSSPAPAFPIGFFLGLFYFLLATALLTVLQQSLEDVDRAPVMALWFMAFGGTVPLGYLAFGPLLDRVGPRWVLLAGAAFSAVLAAKTNLRSRSTETIRVE